MSSLLKILLDVSDIWPAHNSISLFVWKNTIAVFPYEKLIIMYGTNCSRLLTARHRESTVETYRSSRNKGHPHLSQRDKMMQDTTWKYKLLKMRDDPFVDKVVRLEKIDRSLKKRYVVLASKNISTAQTTLKIPESKVWTSYNKTSQFFFRSISIYTYL